MARSYPGSKRAIKVSKKCEEGEDMYCLKISDPKPLVNEKLDEPMPEEDAYNKERGER